MKIINKLVLLGLVLAVMISSNISKTYANDLIYDPSVLRSMEEDPLHYYFGHGFGTGAGTYVDINTIAVELYNPPEYIISYDSIIYNCGSKSKLTAKKRNRLYYNYEKQEVYYEEIENEDKWRYINPLKPHSMNSEADMIFIIAYKMHFYKIDKYQSGYLKGWVKNAQDFISIPYDNMNCEGKILK